VRPVRDCLVPGCGPKPIKGRGYCGLHYRRLWAYGDPLREREPMPKVCIADGCESASLAKSYCQTHYLRFKKHGDPNKGARFYSTGSCHADGCGRSTARGRYCTTHRARLDRYGTTELPPRPERRAHAQGYVLVKRPGHPVAQKDGWAMEHRVVLFDSIGPGEHPCHWCRRPVRWSTGLLRRDSLVVDHLDDGRTNNDLANLAPACVTCNAGRKYLGDLLTRNGNA